MYQFAAEAKNAASSSHLAIESDPGRVNRYAAYKLNPTAAAGWQGINHSTPRVNTARERVNPLDAGGDIFWEDQGGMSKPANSKGNRETDFSTSAHGVSHVNVTWGQALNYSSPRSGRDVHGINTCTALTTLDNYSCISPMPSISQGNSVPNINPVRAKSNQNQLDTYDRFNPLSPRQRQIEIGERLNTYVATITHTPHSHKDKRFRLVMSVQNSKLTK